jgi:hypothetical protein
MKSTMQLFPPGASFTRPRVDVGSIAAFNVSLTPSTANFKLSQWISKLTFLS